ncbi:MAG: response regulator [Deltaproteobacteria bacterium]|nr:response regulator [Deltaproteobacteria bacterium]
MGDRQQPKTGAYGRTTSWLVAITDRFIPPEQRQQEGDDLRRRRLAVALLLSAVVTFPLPAIDILATGDGDKLWLLLGMWILALVLLGVLRFGGPLWVAGHGMALITSALGLIDGAANGGVDAPPAVVFVGTPILMTLLLGRRAGWIWCGVSLLLLIGLVEYTPGDPALARRKAIALGTMTVALAVAGYAFETLRRRALAQLAAARDAAEAAAEAKSRFLANMSHEIRTPMNGVLGMLGILLDTRLAEDQRDYATTAHASGVALLDLLNAVLDFSKIEAGQMMLETIAFDLRALVEDVLDHMAAAAGDKELELIARYVPGTPTAVIGDHGRIRQVLLNLVSNAIKFTEVGHVLVTVDHRKRDDGRMVFRCAVEDTGIGIAPEHQETVFDHFQQVDMSTARVHAGSGLGLAIVSELVALMDGTVGVDSTVDRGSTFWFDVALTLGAPSRPEISPENLRGRKVLVVDDHPVNRQVLSEQLTRWGFDHDQCDSAASALEALRLAAVAGNPFDLAVIDYHMPGMDGLVLSRAIKADPAIDGTVLVMLSSVTHRTAVDEIRAAGCAAYLVKPVHQSDLLNVLATAWDQRHEEGRSTITAGRSLVDSKTLADQPGRGRRVLVVEDNVVNQKVAQRMLMDLGCRVDLAANGREALELIEVVQYDLVLMDVQMPEMDGLAATAELRRREGGPRQLPIVAMTAHAMPADRERCLASGMNAYVSKPIVRRDLVRVMRRFAPGRPMVSEPDPTPDPSFDPTPDPSPGRGADAPCDLEWLYDNYDADDSAVQSLVELFLHRASDLLGQMQAAQHAGDLHELQRGAHALKGISGMVRANRMYGLLVAAPDDLDGTLAPLTAAYAELRRFFAKTLGIAVDADLRPTPQPDAPERSESGGSVDGS